MFLGVLSDFRREHPSDHVQGRFVSPADRYRVTKV